MSEEDIRGVCLAKHSKSLNCPQHFVVQQIIGANEEQLSINVHMRVPRKNPAIEQIIDVFVKKARISEVRVLTDKVIVCGHFEVKAIYVACVPTQAVHAVDAQCVRFTADIPICGARCGMDVDACVAVEFVDYDCDRRSRPYWYKCECEEKWECHHHNHHKKGCHHHKCARKFDVFVTLRVSAKVMTDRPIIVYPAVVTKPKG